MAEAVPSANHLPITARNRRVEVVIALIDGDRHVIRGFLAAEDFERLADRVNAAGVGVEPSSHHPGQETRQGHTAGLPSFYRFFSRIRTLLA